MKETQKLNKAKEKSTVFSEFSQYTIAQLPLSSPLILNQEALLKIINNIMSYSIQTLSCSFVNKYSTVNIPSKKKKYSKAPNISKF
jgi:hypothetical protein